MEINKDKGFVALYRSILDWEWWDNVSVTRVFLYCIIRANWQDTKWQGTIIKRGQFITSCDSLKIGLNMSWQKIKTALEKLITTGEITKEATNKYTLITVTNYDDYQKVENFSEKTQKITNKKQAQAIENKDTYEDSISENNKQITNKQQTNNKQITTDNNLNNITIKQKEKSVNTLAHLFKYLSDEENIANSLIFAKRIVKYYYLENKSFDRFFTSSQLNESKLIKSAISSIDEIEKIIRIDLYSFDDVIETLDFAIDDNFWQKQLHGLSNLRTKKNSELSKFDKINKQYRSKIGHTK